MIIWDFGFRWLRADPVLILLLFVNRCSWTSHWLLNLTLLFLVDVVLPVGGVQKCVVRYFGCHMTWDRWWGSGLLNLLHRLGRVCSEDFLFQDASRVPFEIRCCRELELLSCITTELAFNFWLEILLQGKHSQTGSPWTTSVCRGFYLASIETSGELT